MAFVDDIASDYLVMDGVALVTLTPRNPTGTPITTCRALRLPLGKNLVGVAVNGTELQADDVVFDMWVSTMGASPPEPRRGDEIKEADNTKWAVIGARLETVGTRWYIFARKHK